MRSALALALAAAVVAGSAQAQTTACDLHLNITNQDPAGLNVRATPAGQIITAIKAKGFWVRVHVTGQDGAWASIDEAVHINDETAAETRVFRGHGFVAFCRLGIEELDQGARILGAPSVDAAMLLKFENEDDLPGAEVLGCSGDWLKVKVSGVIGWTHGYCTNQLTTCV